MKLYGLEFPVNHPFFCDCDRCIIRLANASHMRTMGHYLTECCISHNGLSCLEGYYPEYTDWGGTL